MRLEKMSNLNEDDIAEYMEGGNMAMTTKEIFEVKYREIDEDLIEWNELIKELSDKEVALFKWKHVYNVKSEEIIANVDFKKLYGANNQKVLDAHVRNELSDWYDTIKDLEFSVDWITRRISFLRELIRVKRTIMESKQ